MQTLYFGYYFEIRFRHNNFLFVIQFFKGNREKGKEVDKFKTKIFFMKQ